MTMTLQASGDAARARQLLTERAVVRPEVKRLLDKLLAVPVDIEPLFHHGGKAGRQQRIGERPQRRRALDSDGALLLRP